MKSARFALTALLAAAAAGPALAGVMYAPAANITKDGILRKSTVVLSNQSTSLQKIDARFIAQGTPGAPLPEPVTYEALYVNGQVNGIKTFSTAFLPNGMSGMVELVPGYDNMVVGSRIVYQKTGQYSSTVEMPAVGSQDARPASSNIFLQGLEHSSTSGVLSDLGVFNLGAAAASCRLDLWGQDGTSLASNVTFTIEAVSSVLYADFFGPTGTTQGLEVPFNSWAKITCDQVFWAFGVRLDTATGEARAMLPLGTPAQSTLTQPGTTPPPPPPPPGGGTVLLQRNGTFLTFSNSNSSRQHNVRFNFNGGGLNYKYLHLEFDVYVNRWDPGPGKVHCLFWWNKGGGWSNTIGYLNAVEGAGKMRYLVNYGVGRSQDKSPATNPGGWYRVVSEYDTRAGSRKAWFKIWNSTANGNVGALRNGGITFNHNRNTLNIGGAFVELGTQAGEGPEARTLGWKFANMRIIGYR